MLAFHRIAALRGDGLHPKLEALLRERERIESGDGNIVELHAGGSGRAVQSGPSPVPAVPAFLPGNVVVMEQQPGARQAPRTDPIAKPIVLKGNS